MRRWSAGFVLTGLFLLYFNSYAQDQERTVTLTGNRHPLARAEFDIGPAAPDFPMQRMILVLEPTAEQQAALDALVAAQHDPASALYHRWLTPEDFAAEFGVSSENLRRVTDWLSASGFTIEETPAGNRSILFSGTAAQVEAAFHTPIHVYRVNGEIHHANSADPQIPASLEGMVAGAVSLHDFRRTAMHGGLRAAPEYSSGGSYYLAPGDFATIYDAAAAYTAGFTGQGQTIAIVGRINIQLSDIQTFRSTFQLPVNNPTVIVNGPDPGIYSEDEEAEADLDVEWSGAVAPMATVKFVVSESTNSTDGVDLSSQYIVSNNVAPVLSVSFGSCEAAMGSAEMSFYNNLWQQAAAQGITALVAAGDSGAAGCDSPDESTATYGQAINGLCSSTYSMCVGGTEFDENGNYGAYWSATNNASYASALSYIPEVVWNESGSNGGSGLWAGGGGASIYYSKPSWQSGPGVPADSKRDVPDISLSAATHDGYLVDILGGFYVIGGTSCASPSFAGIMALVNQKTGERQGVANTVLYPLAAAQDSGGAEVFHAITGGNNSVPGVTGFTATAHYNQATGLGSPDVLALLNHWSASSGSSGASFSVSASPSTSVTEGSHATTTVTVTGASGFDAAVALSISGLPSGVTAAFAPTTIAAPGSGSSTLTLTASATAATGAYSLTITGTSGSQQKTAALSLTIVPPFTISAPGTAGSIALGASGSVTITTAANSGFSGALTLSASKLPAGVTASFSPATIAAPGSGSSKLTLTVATSATAGSYSITVSATSGSTVESATVSLTIPAPPGFTISATATAATIARGSSAVITVTTAGENGFSGAIALSIPSLPPGVTASFSPASIAAPGNGTSKLTLTVAASATPGVSTLTITGSSGSVVETWGVALTIPAPTFSVTAPSTPVTITAGSSGSVTITTAAQSGFSGAIALSSSGLPKGVTGSFSPTSIAAPGNGTSKFTLTAATTAAPGTYSVTVSGANGSLVESATVSLTIAAPTFNLVASSLSISIATGSSSAITVTTTAQTGFDSAIALSASQLPAGVTAAFSPSTIAAPGNGSSKLTLSVASNATPGTYSITITGTGGSVTESTTVSVLIPASSSYPAVTITANPLSLTVSPGGTASTAITLTPVNGFTGSVTVSYGALPSGISARWSVTSSSASLVFQAASSAPAGTYSVVITGTSTSMHSPATATVTLTVK